MPKQIEENIRNILADCQVEGLVVKLPLQQFDRETYVKVNKCLEGIGGKWNKKAKGHLFDSDPASMLETIVLTGEAVDLKKQFQFFPTPKEVVAKMIDLAELNGDNQILEPSAGKGAILKELIKRPFRDITAIELNPEFVTLLKAGFCAPVITIEEGDFMTRPIPTDKVKGKLFDRVLMNPPFQKLQDCLHIMYAFHFLKPGGILVAICSESPFFRTTAVALAFRDFLEKNKAFVEKLPDDSFRESGTGVNTRIIKIRKAK